MIQRALAPIALALLVAGCTVGQNQPASATVGTLTGVVTGPSGPVSGASLDLIAGDGSRRSAASTADGYFEMDRVPAGTVQLT
ncbi:MAG TPA: carboxypeptidase-like regulatory domain-containing protein, partial [Candidatus Eremiobacteraceae bacterium]|nr:carboxypeptidase-like regulatory domain-containing protein [Candidatus Eremiobacteraceae bacterium]